MRRLVYYANAVLLHRPYGLAAHDVKYDVYVKAPH